MALVFVVNSGSSSIKYQLIDPEAGAPELKGSLERIGEPGGDAADHTEGMRVILDRLGSGAEIAAVGHRVVHGGSRFDRATVIDASVEAAIEELSSLAPLHNPANLLGIRAAREVLREVPHVAVFDTAFHQTMEPAAWRYAIDRALADEHGIRRYGFHGTSHKYVSERTAAVLGRPLEELRTIILHLGNGASVTAVDGGRSVDTSMGLTPLQGLVMGTRSGDLDPAVVFHLERVAGLSSSAVDELLNKRSGLLGLTGRGDMRDVQRAAADGEPDAVEALAIWRHRIRHYIGAYAALLGGVDALVFTAGVGENNALLRRRALQGLEFLGIRIDDDRNELDSRAERRISPDGAGVEVLVIPTDEELEIARQALALIG
ncbi:acetate/propionate family kinase [Homoserinibacter sp. YIM 151385]|uniref:acetate/propionate family kinase n=1 Tax=Homoserinibacter sp. YIM 151385 TaxID=2985506 RepID=UPI0022F0EA8A|nr:acetate kinase [Homoserinibacter sp. YIM 151385]WBU36891.1 acetate kinase [Homoserinibacter sp. YIM 151385]